jgi:hypothetical protein
MILTNYPFDRALVAERQRDQLDHPERMRRTRRARGTRQTRPSTARSRFASWLLGHPAQKSRSRVNRDGRDGSPQPRF